jgi:sugar phosphate isomerase/epimerase
MKLAYSTNAYTRFTLPEAIYNIHRLGFDGIEILGDRPHLGQLDTKADMESLRDQLKRINLPISNINIGTASPLLNEGSVEYIKRYIGYAGLLGAPSISLVSGTSNHIPTQIAEKILLENLHLILSHAEGFNLKIGIEYEPGFYIGCSEALLKLVQRFDHPLLGVNLDIGHAFVLGEDIPWIITLFSDRIWNIHIEDIRDRIHYHLIPGQGEIDFVPILTQLLEIGYDRFLTIELYTYADDPNAAGREGLKHLRSLLHQACPSTRKGSNSCNL